MKMISIKYACERLRLPIGRHADSLWISYNFANAFEKEVLENQISHLSWKYFGMQIELSHEKISIQANETSQNTVYPLASSQICKSHSSKISTVHKQFLATTIKHPEKGTLALYKKLHLSGRKGNEIKEQLLSLGLLKTEEVRNPNGWKKILRPTQKGLALIAE